MLKSRVFILAAAFLAASCMFALSPIEGHLSGRSYVNDYFHLSYTWPAVLKPVAAPGKMDPNAYAVPLFTARVPDQPYGLVIVAEKLNVAGPHSTGVKSSAEFVDRIAGSLRAGPVLSNIKRSTRKNARGVTFEELGYMQSGNHALLMATQAGAYVLVFKCNAPTEAAMAEIEKSVLAARFGN